MTHTPFPAWPLAALPGAHAQILRRDGESYAISIALAGAPQSQAPMPAIFVLDGAEFFLTYAQIAKRIARRNPALTCAVIGVESDPPSVRRARDFTFTPPAQPAPEHNDFGHGEDFLKFLCTEIAPFAAEASGVGFARSALVGHSLAGLFVLHAMAQAPPSFDAYAAFSPSLWWNPEATAHALSGAALEHASLMISVGALEQPPGDARRAQRAMVDRARQLADAVAPRLKACRYELLAGEDHGSAPVASWSRFLRSWLQP